MVFEKKNTGVIDFTDIRIKKTTRDRLKTFGCIGDNYNSLLIKMMDTLEEHNIKV